VNCLNEVEDHNLKGIFSGKTRNTTDSHLLSDADEQLLLSIYVRLFPRYESFYSTSRLLTNVVMPPVQPSRQNQKHRPAHRQFTGRAQVDQIAHQSTRVRFRGCRRCRRTRGCTSPGTPRRHCERGPAD